jgi:hypothetical protein
VIILIILITMTFGKNRVLWQVQLMSAFRCVCGELAYERTTKTRH